MAIKHYPKYKDSEIEWIGKIPEHWDIIRIKNLSQVKRGASPRPIDDPKYFDDNGEYSWVRIADVTNSYHYLNKTTQTLSELGASLSVKIYPGELFLSIAGTVGKPIISQIKCCIHDGFVYFPQLEFHEEYLYRIFETKQPYRGLGKLGTQLNLNTETIGSINIPLPPKEEEQTIATYLDRKTKEIDETIAKKQRLIELLEEERKATINEAVTKGLNPNVKMKDSGIEWIGKIPEHWEMITIKRMVATKVTDGPHATPNLKENGIPFISAEAIRDNKVDFSFKRGYITKEDDIKYSKKCKPQENDIFIVKSGATTGKIAIVNFKDDFNIWSPLALIRCNSYIVLPWFVFYNFQSNYFQNNISLAWSFGTQPNIGMGVIENLKITKPPKKEQVEIADYLKKESKRIYESIQKTQTQIELLKEYRQSLIFEAVTGKIDVREEVKVG